jgi:outer membrane protein assembly factor BamE (lipoprotein component of BamABCDE complex)
MKKSAISLGLLLLAGCASNDSLGAYGVSEVNIENLNIISVGMDEAQVQQIMSNPHSEETIQINDDQYDIWFYVTNPTMLGQNRMVHFNLTPVTFKNDIVASVGWDYYQIVLKSRNNIRNIGRIDLGMTQAQVRQIMHTPEKEEIIPSNEGQYDILFYITSPTGQGSPCEVGSNLTALIFKDNKLISTDCKRYEEQKIAPYLVPTATPGQLEEKSIENALKPSDIQEAPVPEDTTLEKNLAPNSNQIESLPANTNDQPAPTPDKAGFIPSEKQTTQVTSDNTKANIEEQESNDEPIDKSASKKDKGGIDMNQDDEDVLQKENDLNFNQF